MNMLAFTPLMDPLVALYPGMSDFWLWLVVPLVIAISVVYKGTRVHNLSSLPAQATVMTVQILFFMAVAAGIVGGLYWVAIRVV